MIDRLKEKAGSEPIDVHLGNFGDFRLAEKFQLIYVVFNTIFLLTKQEAQVDCFRNVAAHLSDDGCFLIEAFVPNLNRFQGGQVNWASKVTDDVVELDVGQHNAATQIVTAQKVVLTEGNVRLYPIQIRYAWPSELDLMAQLAGLRLRERWSSWQRTPFEAGSEKHISLYELNK